MAVIRPATPHDASQAAPLLCAAWGHLGSVLTGADDDTEAQQIVAHLFTQSGNRVSHENALVAEEDRHIIGVLVCYGGGEAEALDRPLAAQLIARTGDPSAKVRVEAAPHEFYLDTLSVHIDHQRQGIGAALLQAFERRAAKRGELTLGLLVEEGNEAARRLYDKAGYVTDGTIRLGGSTFEHLAKPITAPSMEGAR